MASVICTCPITKTLSVTFNTITPTPSAGYQVGWRLSGSTGAYTYKVPTPTTSPVVFTGVPVCSDIEVIVSSICQTTGNTIQDLETVTALTNQACGNTFNGTHTHSGAYTYPDYLLNVTASTGSTITLSYNSVDKPNNMRFR